MNDEEEEKHEVDTLMEIVDPRFKLWPLQREFNVVKQGSEVMANPVQVENSEQPKVSHCFDKFTRHHFMVLLAAHESRYQKVREAGKEVYDKHGG